LHFRIINRPIRKTATAAATEDPITAAETVFFFFSSDDEDVPETVEAWINLE